MNKDMKRIMFEMMEESIDDVVRDGGFVRRKNSLIYSKKIGTTKQKITMHFNSYYSTIMQIYPWYSVSFPKINDKAKEMTKYDSIYSGIISDLENKLNFPIQLCTKSERWIVESGEIPNGLLPQVCALLKRHTIPLLADLECEDNLIELFEQQDKRIVWDDIRHIFVASAYVLREDYAEALSVLQNRFKAWGPKHHSTILEYIKNLM